MGHSRAKLGRFSEAEKLSCYYGTGKAFSAGLADGFYVLIEQCASKWPMRIIAISVVGILNGIYWLISQHQNIQLFLLEHDLLLEEDHKTSYPDF